MKKLLPITFTILGLLCTTTFAADKDAAKDSKSAKAETTISGEGQCAKCALKETDTCQMAVKAKENGKDVTYYVVNNKVSKDFHKNICTENKDVKVTGKVSDKNGKKEITPTKIELATK